MGRRLRGGVARRTTSPLPPLRLRSGEGGAKPRLLPRSGSQKVARRATSDAEVKPLLALKARQMASEILAHLQCADAYPDGSRRFTSGYLLSAASRPDLITLLRSQCNEASVSHFLPQDFSNNLLRWADT